MLWIHPIIFPSDGVNHESPENRNAQKSATNGNSSYSWWTGHKTKYLLTVTTLNSRRCHHSPGGNLASQQRPPWSLPTASEAKVQTVGIQIQHPGAAKCYINPFMQGRGRDCFSDTRRKPTPSSNSRVWQECIVGSMCFLAPLPPETGSFLFPALLSRNTNTNNNNINNSNCFLSNMWQPRTEPSPCLTL